MANPSTIDLLRRFESRNVTYIAEDGSWPIVWERAEGCKVWDEKGKDYLDLTGAFGVAAAGHTNPAVVRAGRKQMGHLLHAMGDVHPHRPKAELARELSRITFQRWNSGQGKVIFGSSGFEAVEAALKTAILATGKPRVITFTGAYHGLGYGALNATHREFFRSPFREQLAEFGEPLRFPSSPENLLELEQFLATKLADGTFGAVLVEPVQARGGINIPPREFLRLLRKLCDRSAVLLILDEIYTGFGRTGRWFACEHSETVPDLICLGKALTGGFPLSACVGKAGLMDRAWPLSTGEAIHTSTFLGHPVGCSMALAQIRELESRRLCEASARKGDFLAREMRRTSRSLLHKFQCSVRVIGLMAGLEIWRLDGTPATVEVLATIKRLLHRGFIFLPEGEHANVISLTPPLTINRPELSRAVAALTEELAAL